jgi:hypothetical protein
LIRSRLRRVEAAIHKGSCFACPECGLSPDALGRIVHSDSERFAGLPEDVDERCSGCGRRLWFMTR